MVSKAELRQTREYQNASISEQISMENYYLPEARKYKRMFQIPLEIIGVIGMPIATYVLSKKGVIVSSNPNVGQYIAGGLAGLFGGWSLGLVSSSLAYEVFSQEGDIYQFFSRLKRNFANKKED